MIYLSGFLKSSSKLFASDKCKTYILTIQKLNYTKMLKIKAWKKYVSEILTEIKLGKSRVILVKADVAILKSENKISTEIITKDKEGHYNNKELNSPGKHNNSKFMCIWNIVSNI